MVQVGDVVLFRIADETLRPLLVTTVMGAEHVSGRLVLDWERDRRSWFVLNVVKTVENGTVWIEGAQLGTEPGQWCYRKGASK